jgi:hypothetical protein
MNGLVTPVVPVAWMNVAGAATYLDTTPLGVRGLVRRHGLPVHRTPTGRLLFRPEELDEWIDSQAEEAR